jgi:hypothetical protein
MYELKNIGKVFTSKFFETGPSFYKKRIYPAADSQRLRNIVLHNKYRALFPGKQYGRGVKLTTQLHLVPR